MWQRAFIAAIVLLAAATLLRMSSNSTTDHASISMKFTPVVVDVVPTAEQDAQMLQLHVEATAAMRALTAKNAQRKSPREKDHSRMIADTLKPSWPARADWSHGVTNLNCQFLDRSPKIAARRSPSGAVRRGRGAWVLLRSPYRARSADPRELASQNSKK